MGGRTADRTMTPIRLDGRAVAARIRGELKKDAAALAGKKIRPGLAAILLGNDPASEVYVRRKVEACREIGIDSREHRLPGDASEERLLDLIAELAEDDAVDGILVQLPLPSRIRTVPVIEAIPPEKDVDGFHPTNVGRAATGTGGFLPCTPRGLFALLSAYDISVEGMEAVVVGASNLVGRPTAHLLTVKGATVTICQERTRDLAAHTRRAELLVVAAGSPRLIRPEMTCDGAILVDVGINRVGGKLVGDIDPACFAKSRAYAPVPGGVGPMTVAMLCANTLEAARRRRLGEVRPIEPSARW